jgi:hypothetical protein
MRLIGNRRRARRKVGEGQAGPERPGIKTSWLFGVGFLLAIVAFFLADAYRIRYQFTGSYLWVVTFVIGFVTGLFYFCQFLLPLPWQASWYEGLRLTIRHNFPFVTEATRWFFARPRNPAAHPEASKFLSPGFLIHKAGMIESHYAPVINRGASFVRGEEPGYLRLKEGEIINQMVDLRRHFRRMPVKVLTRDGIALETAVSTIFEVKRPENPLDSELPYSYDQQAIFKVNYLGNFNLGGDVVLPWSEWICRQAASAVIGEVSRYTLDELYQPDESGAPPLEKIKGKVKRTMSHAFEKNGIEIITVGMSQFKAPDHIGQQRIANWQTEWERRIGVERGSAEAERARRLKLARARAQIEIIENITNSIEAMRRAHEDDVIDIVALRLIEAIEVAAADDTVKALIPAHIVNDLQLVRGLMYGKQNNDT